MAVALAAAAYLLWRWANDMSGVRREPKVSAIIPLPPPPPPPPEPENRRSRAARKAAARAEPEPVPTPEPPNRRTRRRLGGRRPRQPDADRWRRAGRQRRLQHRRRPEQGHVGGGGGRAGNATYSQYLAYALQKILREDERTRNLTFRLQANIWLTASGQVTRVELTKSSGDADVDARVVAALRAVPALDERPPASVSMPIRASLTGRRPS